jgi:hypothetical protein
MPSEPVRGQGRSWKQQATAANRKQEAQPQWRREPATPSADQRRWSKKTKLGLTALGFLIFCGVLLWAVLLLMPPKPACLVLWVGDDEENLAIPANPSGRTAARQLEALTQSGSDSLFWRSGLLHLKQATQELRTDQPWDHHLEKFKEKTIVLFFAVHGGVDLEGAYLLPQDSNGRADEKNRLRLTRVLDRLAELPKDKNKLLILDATQVTAYWPLGILHNDFARKLEELEPRIAEIPNLLVFSASGLDQRSWVCEEWGTSVFSHFLIEGLKGAADVERRRRINAWDLYSYLSQNVEQWVRANRDALQQPVLLPKDDRGKNLARNIDLVLVKEPYQAPDPQERVAFEAPAELWQAWKTFQELEKAVPSPAVYSPHLWRQYQEYLLRYEQTLRIGDKTGADNLAKHLRDAEQELRQAQHLPLTSAQNSLAMPAAAGLGPFQPEALSKQFDELWTAEADKVREVWEKIQKNHAGSAQQMFRAEMGVLLMKRAAEDPANNLTKAVDLSQLMWKSNLAPAEIQFMSLLRRDGPWNARPPKAYFEVVREALELRLLAESAALSVPPQGHPYSEQVYAWIKERVQAADENRRVGQDYLMVSDPDSVTKARHHLAEAKAQYLAAVEEGNAIRTALEIRDRGFETLPAFSHWLARRPQENQAVLIAGVENLWKNLHELDQALQKPDPKWIGQAWRAVAQTEAVRRGLDELTAKLNGLCRELLSAAVLQNSWRDADDALAVPFIEPELRLRLLGKCRDISLRLMTEPAQKREGPPVPRENNEKQAKLAGQSQGRLALVILGQKVFDRDQEAGSENYDRTQHRLETFLDDPNWWNSLAAAGDQVGRRCLHLSELSQGLIEEGRKADNERTQSALQLADRFTRLMEAGTGLSLGDKPVDEYRRRLTQGWVAWQAERTWGDHLYDLDPKAEEPYYRLAGKLFLDDARRLDPLKLPRPGIDAVQKKLGGPGELAVDGPQRLNLTSELKVDIGYQIHPVKDAQVPSGYPVIGVSVGKELQLAKAREGDRQIRKLEGDAKIESFAVSVSSPAILSAEQKPPLDPRPISSVVKAVGIYRGQRFPLETNVNLYPLPENTQVQPRVPDLASIAVRANDPTQFGRSPGAVVIILDCSGSMATPCESADDFPKRKEKKKFPTRFDKAVQAIGQVLQDLEPGVQVSVWAFSHKTAKAYPHPEQIWEPSRWAKKDWKKLMDEFNELWPYLHTPLVRAMWEAKKDFPKDFKGSKTMLVLTDGADDEFAKDSQLQRLHNTSKISEFMNKEFKDSGIQVNMVCYEIDQTEKKDAERDFQVISSKDWSAPGNLYFEDKPQKLLETLRKSLRRALRYSVERNDGTAPGLPEEGLQVSRTGANYNWFQQGLRPQEDYFVRPLTDQLKKKRISLEKGDRLLLELVPNPNNPFRRLLFSEEEAYRLKPAWEQDNWRLAVLQNQKITDHDPAGLGMFVTLEKKDDPDAVTLKQVKPTVWMEIRPEREEKQPYAVRWRSLSGYPGPSWSFDLPQWPTRSDIQAPATSVIQAWWSEQPVPAVRVLNKKTENKKGDFSSLEELVQFPVRIEGEEIVLESVQFEEHWVEIKPGLPKEKKNCLVVRLGQVKDYPVWVRLEGIEPTGHEHRFYTEAGKYTGIFWPVTEQKAKADLTGLSFMSLKAFKQQAERANYVLTKAVGEPQASDSRPQPIPLQDDNDRESGK